MPQDDHLEGELVTVRTRWLIGVVAAVGYGLLWLGWVGHWSWPAMVDASLLDPAYRYGAAHPDWVLGWRWVCFIFGPWTFQLVAVVIAVVALVRRQRRTAIFLMVGVVLSGLLTELAKDVAQRSRPLTALAHEPSWSFPSGHALGTMAGALGLCAVFRLWGVARLKLIEVVCAVIVLTIGVGRVMLNVHHPTDVLAGWLLALMWFLVCLPILTSGPATTGPAPTAVRAGT